MTETPRSLFLGRCPAPVFCRFAQENLSFAEPGLNSRAELGTSDLVHFCRRPSGDTGATLPEFPLFRRLLYPHVALAECRAVEIQNPLGPGRNGQRQGRGIVATKGLLMKSFFFYLWSVLMLVSPGIAKELPRIGATLPVLPTASVTTSLTVELSQPKGLVLLVFRSADW